MVNVHRLSRRDSTSTGRSSRSLNETCPTDLPCDTEFSWCASVSCNRHLKSLCWKGPARIEFQLRLRQNSCQRLVESDSGGTILVLCQLTVTLGTVFHSWYGSLCFSIFASSYNMATVLDLSSLIANSFGRLVLSRSNIRKFVRLSRLAVLR